MKYQAIPVAGIKPCVRHGCRVPAIYMIVSRDTLRKRRTNPKYGTHYYTCVAHTPATAEYPEGREGIP